MKVEFDITKITVIQGFGADKVYLRIAGLPEAVWPYILRETDVHFEAAAGSGPDYVAKHFSPEIPFEVIKT